MRRLPVTVDPVQTDRRHSLLGLLGIPMTRSGHSFLALLRWGVALAMLLLADGLLSSAADRHGKPPVPGQQLWEWIDQANALEAKGACGKAATARDQVLAWREQAQGPDHPDTATSLNNLAKVCLSQGAVARAEPLLRRGIGSQSLFLKREAPLLLRRCTRSRSRPSAMSGRSPTHRWTTFHPQPPWPCSRA